MTTGDDDAPTRPSPPAEDPPRAAPLPATLGRFKIVAELGRGGMGVVYRATDERLGRDVAVKTLVTKGVLVASDALERLRQEALALARLRHPSIVAIHEIGELETTDGDRRDPFIVMDLVEGVPLHQASLSLARALEVMRDTALAIQVAHAHGVLHRDVKPHNIIIDAEGRPHVLDFGLARLVDRRTVLTKTGVILGTAAYMPPEQTSGRGDPRSDVYSLGATLYHLVTGKPPFEGATELNVLAGVLMRAPVAPSAINPAARGDLDTVCLRCLEKDPGLRYAKAAELAADLDRIIRGDPIAGRRAGTIERLGRHARRRWRLVATTLAASALLALAIAIGLRKQSAANALVESERAALALATLSEKLEEPLERDPTLSKARSAVDALPGRSPLLLCKLASLEGEIAWLESGRSAAEPILARALSFAGEDKEARRSCELLGALIGAEGRDPAASLAILETKAHTGRAQLARALALVRLKRGDEAIKSLEDAERRGAGSAPVRDAVRVEAADLALAKHQLVKAGELIASVATACLTERHVPALVACSVKAIEDRKVERAVEPWRRAEAAHGGPLPDELKAQVKAAVSRFVAGSRVTSSQGLGGEIEPYAEASGVAKILARIDPSAKPPPELADLGLRAFADVATRELFDRAELALEAYFRGVEARPDWDSDEHRVEAAVIAARGVLNARPRLEPEVAVDALERLRARCQSAEARDACDGRAGLVVARAFEVEPALARLKLMRERARSREVRVELDGHMIFALRRAHRERDFLAVADDALESQRAAVPPEGASGRRSAVANDLASVAFAVNRAEALEALGRRAEARAALDRIVADHPRHGHPRLSRAELLLRLDPPDLDAADADVAIGLEDPEWKRAAELRLSDVAERRGHYAQALELCRSLLPGPDPIADAEIVFRQARILVRLDRRDDAATALEEGAERAVQPETFRAFAVHCRAARSSEARDALVRDLRPP